jgi:hypothetical protein
MYRKCKKIYLFWFGDVHGMEGNTIVLVLTFTVSRSIEHCVVLNIYGDWKETELWLLGAVQRLEGNRIVLV